MGPSELARPLGALLLGALAACGGESPPPARGPNVLLVSLDSVRRDALGCYGRRPVHAPELSPSPRIDALAAEGLLFEDACATSSWTLPSHATLLTGRSELEHGVEEDGLAIGPEVPLLAERLARAGYRTAGIYSGPYLDPRHGFGRGFERYEAAYGEDLARAVRAARAAEGRLAAALESGDAVTRQRAWEVRAAAEREVEVASHRDVSSSRVAELARAELVAAAEDVRPFFLFLHFFDPHYDYAPPPPFDRLFDPDYQGELDGRDYYTDPRIASFDPETESGRRRVVDERGLEHLVALYEGEIAWTDRALGTVLDALADLGLAGGTLVVVTSDHGDEFFEHGAIGHRRTLFEEVLDVPLVVRLPGWRRAGERPDQPVPLSAVVPTILDEAGVARGDLAGRPGLFDAEALARDGFVVRLVTSSRATLDLDLPRATVPVPAEVVRVQEGWRGPDTKVLRERRFLRPATSLRSDEARAAFERRSRELFAGEELAWYDLAVGEAPTARHTAFDAAPGREALAAYQRALQRLNRFRTQPAPDDPVLAAALRALGYAGVDRVPAGDARPPSLELPPPGERP